MTVPVRGTGRHARSTVSDTVTTDRLLVARGGRRPPPTSAAPSTAVSVAHSGPRHRRGRDRRRTLVAAAVVAAAVVAGGVAAAVTGVAVGGGGQSHRLKPATNVAELGRPAVRPSSVPSARTRPPAHGGRRTDTYGDSLNYVPHALPSAIQQTAGSVVSGVITRAESELGVSYSWGGGTPNGPSEGFAEGAGIVGFDCSSFVQYAWWPWAHLPRTADKQAYAGVDVTREQLRPGDLIATNAFGHIMLYIGNGEVIEARHTGTVISIQPMPAAGSVDAYVHIAPAG